MHTYIHIYIYILVCVICFIQMCNMTHPHVWHGYKVTLDSSRKRHCTFIHIPWLIRIPFIWATCFIFICVTFILHMCDLTCPHTWHASFVRVTCLIHTCDMTHSSVWHDSFMYATCLMIHIYDMLDSYVWHDSSVVKIVTCAMWLIHICNMTHSYVWRILFYFALFRVFGITHLFLRHVTYYSVWHWHVLLS